MFVKRYAWSHAQPACVVCGKTSAKHHGRGVCNTCYTKILKAKNPQYRIDSNERTRRWNKELRLKVLSAYANPIVCACCGEDNRAFLTIDHINNDGSSHRKLTKGSGSKTYAWLYKNGFPEGYQVLCFNCNHAKYINGKCPHELS